MVFTSKISEPKGLDALQSEQYLESAVYSAESHERHGEEAGCDECYRHSLHGLWYAGKLELLTQSGKDDHGEGEAEGCGDGIDDAGEESELDALAVVLVACHLNGNTEDTAVGGDEWEEHAECLIE